MPTKQPVREKDKEAGERVWACWVWHHLHPFKYLFKCTFWHKLSLLLHFCPTSIKSTPKMIICLRQIILRKAIYPITIPLLYPQSQTSSLECVFVWICTQYTAYLFLPANIHVYTRAPLPFLPNLLHCNLFSRVHLHNCMVSLDSSFTWFFFRSTNMYILS